MVLTLAVQIVTYQAVCCDDLFASYVLLFNDEQVEILS